MIRVNLLPPELDSAPSEFNPAIPLGITGAVVAGILFFSYGREVSKRDKQKNEISVINSEIKQLEPIIAQVDQLESAKAQLSQKKGVIQSIESERLRYPQFMDDLVRLLPANVWLTNLVTVPVGNNFTVTLQVSALDNYALADLVANLESSQIFTDTELGAVTVSQNATGGQALNFQVTTSYRKAAGNDAIKKS